MSSIFGTGSVGLSSFEVDPKLAVLNDTPEKAYAKVASPDKVYTTAEATWQCQAVWAFVSQ